LGASQKRSVKGTIQGKWKLPGKEGDNIWQSNHHTKTQRKQEKEKEHICRRAIVVKKSSKKKK